MSPRAHLQQAAFLTALLVLWELASRFGPWPHHLFPGPGAVAQSLWRMIQDGRLGAAVTRSLSRLAQGYALSACIGVPLGVTIARSRQVKVAIRPLVLGLQALPSICWLPLAVLWFGLSEWAILFVVVMGSLLAITISTEDGVSAIDPLVLRAAGTLGITGARFYGGVLVPAALPGIVTGLKLGWSFAWRALMAGELLFVAGGLGQLLANGRELLDVPQVMAVMVAIVFIGSAVDQVVFHLAEVRVRRRWGLSEAT
ncbi:MAG TPA: ABC transporter permease [Anaeromyxobacteraceae bacterium]|jgi:NitT/TauT family transport system permease protein|nr:ABC transporter permease [Anaeromyxobacteraceae bacterium]